MDGFSQVVCLGDPFDDRRTNRFWIASFALEKARAAGRLLRQRATAVLGGWKRLVAGHHSELLVVIPGLLRL
jgi:hypothetical protein